MRTVREKCLLFRADASVQNGTGHVMRCLALAQAWQDDGGHSVFAQAETTAALTERLTGEGFEVVPFRAEPGSAQDAEHTVRLAQRHGANWVVADGYRLGAAYQKAVKQAGLRLLVLDDYGHAEHYHADLILNQNLGADAGLYASREPYTQLLLGTRYALLRREFRAWQGWRREFPALARNVLVTLGGSDPQNVTLKVMQALAKVGVEGLTVKVVVGGSNPHHALLKAAAEASPCDIQILQNVPDMPTLMAWADVAVSAGGSTCWELAFMGLPSLLTVLADNQHGLATRLDAEQAAVCLAGHGDDRLTNEFAASVESLLHDASRREHMAGRAQSLVDGVGCRRVVERIGGSAAGRLDVRRVRREDCALLWEWANDPATRAVSFSSDPIPWEQHVAWFQSKISDPDNALFLGVSPEDGLPVGQARFAVSGQTATLSISLDSRYRGKGVRTALIARAAEALLEAMPEVAELHAWVKPDNTPSLKVFRKSGWCEQEETLLQGHRAVRFIWRRSESA